jgi:short-subunit dehydrogenase
MQLKGKNVVVTGGAGGIGSQLCAALAEQGANITVIDRVETLPFEAGYVRGDLGSLEGIQAVAEQLKALPVDVLVNLAGIQYFGEVEQQQASHTALGYMVNLLAPVMLTQAVLPRMKQRREGHIVNIGSIFGSINFAYFATYSSSKAGLKGFSEALRREVAADGVRVTYIAPRAVRTPLNTSKVMELAERTKMHMDAPELVVSRITQAVLAQAKDVYIGFPESLFVRVNALLPRLVDKALAKNDAIARHILTQSR